MLGGNVTSCCCSCINAVFRGAGDAAIAMRVLWLGNVLNIVLGPCFIFGLGPFPRARRHRRRRRDQHRPRHRRRLPAADAGARPAAASRIRREHLRLDLAMMQRVAAAVGLGHAADPDQHGQLRRRSSASSRSFGSAALAGYTIGIRIIIFALLPAFGMSNAAATMVGQNLGAGQSRPRRAGGLEGGASTT